MAFESMTGFCGKTLRHKEIVSLGIGRLKCSHAFSSAIEELKPPRRSAIVARVRAGGR